MIQMKMHECYFPWHVSTSFTTTSIPHAAEHQVSLGPPWALEEHTVRNTQWCSHVDTTVSTMALQYTLARCKEK